MLIVNPQHVLKLTTIVVLAFQLVSCGVESSQEVGAESVTDTQKVQIRGQLLSHRGEAVTGAEVSIFSSGESMSTTDEGKFVLQADISDTELAFVVRGDNFSALSTPLVVLVDGSTIEVVITLASDRQTAIATLISGVDKPEPVTRPSPTATSAQNGAFGATGDTTSFGIPNGFVGNRNRGKSKYFQQCASCHSSLVGTHENFPQLKRIIAGPPMNIRMHDASLADIVAYLRYSGGAR